MRINNDGINKMLNIYNRNQGNVDNTNKTGKSKKLDQLDISSNARDFQIAMEEVKKQPDVREEKVARIKRQIESGTYEIDAKKIADKMMQDANIFRKL